MQAGGNNAAAGKNNSGGAVASVKESIQNIGASAVSGLEKTKAVAQEKVDKISAHSIPEKELATEKKEERIREAELNKQHVVGLNAAAKSAGGAPAGHPSGQAEAYAANPASTVPGSDVAGVGGDTTGVRPGGHKLRDERDGHFI